MYLSMEVGFVERIPILIKEISRDRGEIILTTWK